MTMPNKQCEHCMTFQDKAKTCRSCGRHFCDDCICWDTSGATYYICKDCCGCEDFTKSA